MVASIGLVPLTLLALPLPLPEPLRVLLMLLGAAWLSLGRLVVPRLRRSACVVEVQPGGVAVRGAGLRSQRIRAAEIRAASTAQMSDAERCAVGLVRYADGDWPMWLEMETPEDADRVRRALGVGHWGFGEIVWPPRSGSCYHVRPSAVDVVAAVAWLGVCIAALSSAVAAAVTAGTIALALTMIGAAAAALPHRDADSLCLSPQGLVVVVRGATLDFRWAEIVGASEIPGGILVHTRGAPVPARMKGASLAERTHFVAQIQSAVRRARGEGPGRPAAPPSLAILVPRDEPARVWLERLDATAASLRHTDRYRHAGVEESELWSALESPDAPGPLRAAAARILARLEPVQAGPRIAQVLAQERDTATRARISVALEEDIELAAGRIDLLDRVRGP
jgi:hypothetical protein